MDIDKTRNGKRNETGNEANDSKENKNEFY